jgi:dipeptidyl aminopeptidase/acylaminoacyl peptidase
VLLAHGTRDKVFSWDSAKAIYTALRGEGYPVRFVSFETGNHGTPIRMIDWRDSLNWVLGQAAE